MQWIIDNWLTLLLVIGMLAMHLFGHGHGHGRHEGQRRLQRGDKSEPDQTEATDAGTGEERTG